MYAVQIHSLELITGDKNVLKNRNIFLDVSSEGQRPRRYFMGTFAKPCVRHYESIIHFSDSAVTVNLNYGPFRYHFLGVHTIYEFLNNSNVFGQKQTVTFGKRGKSPTFTLSYAISKINCGYSFMLNEVTCLKQVSSSWRKDELYAEVEYNYSTHSIDRGARNKYELGRFSSYDVSSINSVHNFTFSTFSNFVITFGVKSLFSDHILSAFRFVPLAELLNNLENPDDDVNETDQANHSDAHKEIGVKSKSNEDHLKELKSHNHGLMFVKYDPEETYEEFVPLKVNKKLTRRVVITSAEGGSYEILFTLTIDMEAVNNYIGSPRLFGPLETPSMFPEDVEARDAIRLGESNWVPLDENEEILKPAFEQYSMETINSEYSEVDCKRFSYSAVHNHVEVLIDGRETFKRYYEMMMQAQHSISILAWELSLSFGLVVAQSVPYPLPALYDGSSTWITLEDVLLSKAKEGTKIRIIVWRHELLSQLNRFLYLGEVTIEREVAKLEKRCKKMGIDIKIFHTYDIPEGSHPFSDPFSPDYDVPFIVVIAGNPRGLISCHHEKLLLIDAECPEHTVAFTGGFDIARGRYDQPSHTIPHALSTRGLVSKMMPLANSNEVHLPKRGRRDDHEGDADEEKASEALVNKESKRVTAGMSVQPILPEMRFLWHDIQLFIKGPAVRVLYLHFMQRWIHSFSPNPNTTKSFVLHSPSKKKCTKHRALKLKGPHNNCEVRLHRTWKGVFDVNFLFDMHKKLLQNARKFLYIEHQYPFQNFALAYALCEALKKNPQLQVIIVTPVKTDLPTGLVGELFDWSQDHIIDHLQVIHRTAPDRVGIYGLVNQDKNQSDQIRSIYVHSKMIIVDDEYIVTGSTNLDNVSFHYSSELSVSIFNKALARETRIRLFKEHLGHFYEKQMDDNFDMCFKAYHHIASLNLRSFSSGSTSEQTILHGRPVFMAPEENYQLLLKKVYYPNKITKFLTKMGVYDSGDDLKQLITSGYNKVRGIIKMAKL